jgi:hypothetical protein
MLGRFCDPEWLGWFGCLMIPPVCFLAIDDLPRATFFLGIALNLGSLKWLGWFFLGRRVNAPMRFALFPAEVLAGLGLACVWFYLRNGIGILWPEWYGLGELSVLTGGVLVLQGAVGLVAFVRWLRSPGEECKVSWRAVLDRGMMYAPFVLTLVATLWLVSPTLHVHSYDPIHHAFSARIYHAEGTWYSRFNGGQPILYTTGFGAINALTLALSPLTPVQAVNMQHVVLLVTGLFLITGALVIMVRRPLWPIHWLVLFFLVIFPLHDLEPMRIYIGTGRQVAPALLLAVCLLPYLIPGARWRDQVGRMAVETMLALVCLALNPATAPYVAAAMVLALVMSIRHAGRQWGLSWWKVVTVQGLLAILLGSLVLASDPYYLTSLKGRAQTIDPAQDLAIQPLRFDWPRAARELLQVRPLELTTEGWQGDADGFLIDILPWLVFLQGGVLVGWTISCWRPGEWPQGTTAISTLVQTGMVFWLGSKYVVHFLAGGLPAESWDTKLLADYLMRLQGRVELVLLFLVWVASAVALCRLSAAQWSPRARWRVPLCLGIVWLSWSIAYLVGLVAAPPGSFVIPDDGEIIYLVTDDDLRLVAWIDENIAPGQGLIGLAVWALLNEKNEKHMVPMDGVLTLILYGRHLNYCFAQIEPNRKYGFDDYVQHVRENFDAEWCLANDIRFFYIVDGFTLSRNPGLVRALETGHLKPLRRIGASCLYQVVVVP